MTRYAVSALRDVAVPRLRIAVLADFHANTPFMTAPRVRSVVERTAALGADLILLLGDYAGHVIGGTSLRPDAMAAELAALRAPQGVFAIFGNHDWYDDPDPEMALNAPDPTIWHRAFADRGIPTLSNAVRVLDVDGVALQLAGLESQQAFKRRRKDPPRPGADDLPAVMNALDPAAFTLMMAHEPDVFPDLDAHVDLTLSGHTHGGQIAPFGLPLVVPSRYGRRYAYGHRQEGTKQLVVSGGLGNTTLPFRIGRPPEIVVIDLAAAA